LSSRINIGIAKGGGYTAAQLDWIEDGLMAPDQRYKFVIGHEPEFPMDRHAGDSLDFDPVMRDAFWTVLADNGETVHPAKKPSGSPASSKRRFC
jgi:hypothetical protein